MEAASQQAPDVAAAENLAATTRGVVAVSNSYGLAESGAIQQYAPAYDHPGVAITVASGDSGYRLAASFPSTLMSVISVGGTELDRAAGTTRGRTERAWSTVTLGRGTGSWCSAWVERPAWQKSTICSGRLSVDVSADADPSTGPAVYDSTPYDGTTLDWVREGGTSASAPFVAGVYALAGNTASVRDASGLYTHSADLFDVTTGQNVTKDSCDSTLICTAKPGYDAVTGNGTPDGIGAF